MIYEYTYDKSFIVLNKKLTKNKFMKYVNVGKGSFAWKLYENIFYCITCDLEDVEKTYKRYYSKEYTNIKQYLYRKYNIRKKTIDIIFELLEKDKHYTLYHRIKFAYGDSNLEQFVFSDTMINRLEKILLLRRINENKV